jgi:hypothetical protein
MTMTLARGVVRDFRKCEVWIGSIADFIEDGQYRLFIEKIVDIFRINAEGYKRWGRTAAACFSLHDVISVATCALD